jgi:hypothetical protein
VRCRSEPTVVRLSLVVEAPVVGRLADAETAKNKRRNRSVTMASPPPVGLADLGGGCVVSDKGGGITGTLLETRSGRRLQRNESMCRHAAPTVGVVLLLWSWYVRLEKLDDAELVWYNGTGLAKADEGTLSSCDDE